MRTASRHSPLATRLLPRGVTLVELLVVIMIISILAAMVLGVAAIAGENAREAKTRSMIGRLHSLLIEHYDSFKNRRVDVSVFDEPTIPGQLADNRLLAHRQLMKMELPDRWSDIIGGTAESVLPDASNSTFNALKANLRVDGIPRFLHPPTAQWGVYLQQYRRLVRPDGASDTQWAELIRENQGAECLHMIIVLATGDGEARSLFHESDIGDTDGDGAKEFLDGWGNPIGFLRWAPGFPSDLQLSPARIAEISADAVKDGADPNQAERDAIAADHDPFDLFRRDQFAQNLLPNSGIYVHLRDERSAYRLLPLIYSRGRDEDADINIDPADFSDLTWRSTFKFIDPYAVTSNTLMLGAPFTIDNDGDNWVDNIHNHLLGTR